MVVKEDADTVGFVLWQHLLGAPCFRAGSVPKPLSQIQRSTRWLLQGLSPRPSFGGFGLSLGIELTIDQNLTLNGADSGDTIIQAATSSADATSRVLTIGVGLNVAISGVTIQNGRNLGNAGGIENRDTLSVTNSTVKDNIGESDGGGIWNQGTLTLTNSVVTGNTAPRGAGIENRATLTVTNSSVNGNIAEVGGGFRNRDGGILTLMDNTVSGNTAALDGGGIFSRSGTVSLINTTVSGNTANIGGGIRNDSPGTLSVIDSVINGNNAASAAGIFSAGATTVVRSTVSFNIDSTDFTAGGIAVDRTTLTVINSTIHGNRGGRGGIKGNFATANITNSTITGNHGFLSGGGVSAGGTFTFTNTIIAGNTTSHNQNKGPDCVANGSTESGGHNLIGIDCEAALWPVTTGDIVGTQASPVNPFLGPLQDNGGPTPTRAPLPGSPALDGGGDGVLGSPLFLTTDQRGAGFPRLQGAHVDIGAFEATPPEPAQSSPFTVTKTGDADDGLCGVNDCSLREAIASGDSGDAINIPLGVYTLTLGTELAIDQNLSLTGAGSGDTIIQAAASSADATHRVLTVSGDRRVSISGVTIRHGNIGEGGGVLNNGNMTLTNSSITGNTAVDGGGLMNRGSLTMANSTIIANSTPNGSGAGITNRTGANLIVTHSIIAVNLAGGSGGGIENDGGSITLDSSTVSGNFGNGIVNGFNSTVVLINSTVSGNGTSSGILNSAGGILNFGTLTLTNSTLSDNSASGPGAGGIHNVNPGTVELVNTIVSGNTASLHPDCKGVLTTLGHNLVGDATDCGFTPATGDLVNVDPFLGPLQDNGGPTLTHALLPGSPAIDAGDDIVLGPPHILTGDQRGEPRLSGMHVDIGAYELQATPPPTLPRMPALQQQFDILADPDTPPELALEAINRLPGIIIGSPVVLPTSGGQVSMKTWMETVRFYNRAKIDLVDAIAILGDVKLGNAARSPHVDSGVRAHANQVSVLLEGTLSVIRGLAHQVGGIDPAGTIPPRLRTDRQRIESPFLPLAPVGFGLFPIERTEVCNVESGENSSFGTDTGGSFSEFSSHSRPCVITKESFGVKAVLFHRIIPVYQEPWEVRESPIIGHEVVWYIRWVLAEHIKTIIYERDSTGKIRMRIGQRDVLMPGLSKFWSFYPP